MKISLVFPRMKYKSGDPPLGMAMLTAVIREQGHDVDLIDTTFNPTHEYVQKRLDSFNPDMVCVYSDSMMFEDATKIMQYAKDKGKTVLAGGPHATLKPETLKEFADYIVQGEAEETIIEIIDGKHKGTQIIKGNQPDLEKLPVPAYDLLDMDTYMDLWHLLDSVDPSLKGTSLFSSRGCPYRCSFCQPVLDKIFGKGFRRRSVDSVVAEIKYLTKKFGMKAFFFQDDTFTVDRRWVVEFADRLIAEDLNILWGCNSRINLLDEELLKKLHKAGLHEMHIGVESGSQRVLDEIYQKDIKLETVAPMISIAEKIGVHCLCFFMLGAPGETEEEIEETIRYARSLDATEITATISTPLPETHMYEKTKDAYNVTNNFEEFDYYKNQAFDNPDINFKRLKFLQKKLLISFYTHPKRWPYIARHFTSVNGIKKMINKVKRFS